MHEHAHGHYEIHWSGTLCRVWLRGPFNGAGAEALIQRIRLEWRQQGEPTAWAELVDLSGWEGRTPDSNDVLNRGLHWLHAHGLRALALVASNRMASLLVDMARSQHPLQLQRGDLAVAFFEEERAALTWLASLGLSN